MKRSQVDRSVVAARAAAAGRTGRRAMYVEPVTPIRHVRRTRAVKMTGAQRNSEGRMSEWAMSPQFFTDPKWGATCSTV